MAVFLFVCFFWGGGAAYQGGEEVEVGMGDTNEQPLSDKPPLIQCRETYRILSSNLHLSFSEAQQKSLC